MRFALCASLIFLISCKKENISINKKMANERIFYTQEGTGYVLKSINKFTEAYVIAAPTSLTSTIYCNPTPLVGNNFFDITFQTTKRIIPISFSFQAMDIVTGIVEVDQLTPYIKIFNSDATINNYYRNAIPKIYPYVQRNFYTSLNLFNYQIQYNQLVFSDNDFAFTQDMLIIIPSSNFAEAVIFNSLSGFATMQPGTYNIYESFTYFEMI